tara:strand:- start:951 stop:1526 length:576 start_codon:yes stop_codon:yes gene_type:complete
MNKANIILSSVIFSLLLGAYHLVVSPSDEGPRLWAKYSAHLAFFYLLSAYAASILRVYFKCKVTKDLVRHRRYFGLGFTVAHTFHLVALVNFFVLSNEEPSTVSIVGGGLGYLLVYMMAITSTDTMAGKLGAKNWKTLHRGGINYLIIIFLYAFVGAILATSIYSVYAVYVLAILLVWALKFVSWLRAKAS